MFTFTHSCQISGYTTNAFKENRKLFYKIFKKYEQILKSTTFRNVISYI